MAREIYYARAPQPNGRESVRVCYVFPVSPRVTDVAGAVVKWNWQDIPALFRGVLTAAQQTAMEAGDMGWLFTTFERTGGETLAGVTARLRADYDALSAYEIAQKRAAAAETGAFDPQRGVLDR